MKKFLTILLILFISACSTETIEETPLIVPDINEDVFDFTFGIFTDLELSSSLLDRVFEDYFVSSNESTLSKLNVQYFLTIVALDSSNPQPIGDTNLGKLLYLSSEGTNRYEINIGSLEHAEFYLSQLLLPMFNVKSSIQLTVIPERVEAEELQNVLELMPERAIDNYGVIGILTGAKQAGSVFDFLPAISQRVYNNSRDLLQGNHSTMLIIYEATNDLGFPPSQFGVEVFPGEVAGVEKDGVLYIFVKSSDQSRSEMNRLTASILRVRGVGTFEDFTSLVAGVPITQSPRQEVEDVTSNPVTFSGVTLVSKPLDVCRIQQTQNFRPGHNDVRGFPMKFMVPPKGEVNIAIIAVEFDNSPGEQEFLPIYQSQIETIESWAEFVSGGELKYKVHFPNQWVKAPKGAEYYTNPEARQDPNSQNKEASVGRRLQSNDESISQIITAANDLVDWSVIDYAHFIFPYETEKLGTFLYAAGGRYVTPTGVYSFPVYAETVAMFSPTSPNPMLRTHWDWIIHEVLHYQGLIGHGPLNGSNLGVMMNQHGLSKALISWESFLMGHYDEDDIECIDASDVNEPIVLRLESLDELGGQPGIKSVMLKLSSTEIVVIEYRTDGPFSSLPYEFHGFTAYHLNLTKPWVRCDGCSQLDVEQENFWRYLRNDSKNQVCREAYGQSMCNQPAVIQKPGYHLEFQGLRLDFFDNQQLSIRKIQ